MLCEPLEYFALFLSLIFYLLTENFLVEFEAKEGRCRNKRDAYQMSYEKSHNPCKKSKAFSILVLRQSYNLCRQSDGRFSILTLLVFRGLPFPPLQS